MNYPVIVRDRAIEPFVEDEIRLRAYYLFLRRGKGDGHAMDDWLEAERDDAYRTRPNRVWNSI